MTAPPLTRLGGFERVVRGSPLGSKWPRDLTITASFGVTQHVPGETAQSLLQRADSLLYEAKASGRNNYKFFRPDMNTRVVRRQIVETGLRRALKEGEFRLHYQPQIDLASGAMNGAEALVRWLDPELGIICP